MERARRHLLIRAFNSRPAGASLRDQFFGISIGATGATAAYLTRADVEAALRVPPGSKRSDRLLRACFPSDGWVDTEAFVAFLEQGTPHPFPSPCCRPPPPHLALALIRPPAALTTCPRTPPPLLPLPDSTNEAHPLRRRPHWRKREVVVEDRLVEYTTVDAAGAAQSLVERERTVTEVVHWEAPLTGEAAHRERVWYRQREEFDGAETGACAGEEEYVHIQNAAQEAYESLRSTLPDRYYEGHPPPPSQGDQGGDQHHRRQRSAQHRYQQQQQQEEEEEEEEEERRSLSSPLHR